MVSSKASGGLKKVRYSRRPQRRQKAQKRKVEQQKRIIGQGVVDKEDRKIGFAKWQQQRVSLSQLILPKPSNSAQKDGGQISIEQQNKNREKKKADKAKKLEEEKIQKKNEAAKKEAKMMEKEKGKKGAENAKTGENAESARKESAMAKDDRPKGKGKEADFETGKRSQKNASKGNDGKNAGGKSHKGKDQHQKVVDSEKCSEQKKEGHQQQNGRKCCKEAASAELLAKSAEGCDPSVKECQKMEKILKEQSEEKPPNEILLINGNDNDANGLPLTIDTSERGEYNNGADEESLLTKCSVDSGVEEMSGNDASTGCEAQSPSCRPTSSPLMGQSTGNKVERKEEEKGTAAANGGNGGEEQKMEVKKVEKRVYEFVDNAMREQMQVQKTLLVNTELVAPLLQPLKVEPLNLERIRLVAERKTVRKPRQFKLLDSDIKYCEYMEREYGRDYEAMNRDAKNVFGDSPKSMERKLRIYKDFLKQQQQNGDGTAI